MVMEGLIMRYLITMKVNGKVTQEVYVGETPIAFITGYLQAKLDNGDDPIWLDDLVIKRLKD